MSERVGKKRSTVANYIRLLKLDPIVQTGMRDGFLSMGHGRALINVDESEKQLEIYEKIIARTLSVRETELLVQKSKKSQSSGTSKASKPIFYDDAANELKSYFNTTVSHQRKQKGKGTYSNPV